MRSRSPVPVAALAAIIVVLVGACASSGPGWTFAPAIQTAKPSGGASTEPSASASADAAASADASASASAGTSAAPSDVAPASGAPGSAAPASAAPASGAPASAAPSGSTASPSPSPSASAAAPNDAYTVVGTKPCPGSRFECVTLAVPKDHFAAPGGETWDVTFAIQRAAKEKKGTFVVITGGPGSSGISAADDYTDYYAQAITDSYDIVFLDQRGTGASKPIQCVDAAATFYQSTARPQVPAELDQFATDAETFAKDCITETGIDPTDLPYFATTQAVEDLEAVRDYLAADKLQLYGESYGTQFVQTYAAAYPDRIDTLFVDGPVDLTMDGPSYYVEATRSAEDTLVTTLDACTADPTCKADIRGGDAQAVYDALAARLATSPISYDFPLGDGTTSQRQLTDAALEYTAFYQLYSRADREGLQRAIASASHDDFVPLAKLYYDSLGVDPDTLKPVPDPTWSDAAYYAIECQDYAFYPTAGDAKARVSAWAAGATAAGIDHNRVATSYFEDMPCIYWPETPTTNDRPAPVTDPPYRVVVLTSTTDPATPIANGMRIYSRLKDAYFFQAVGGPHVIYAWGDACPDDQMTALIADDTPPAARITTCDGKVAADYVRNAALAKSGYKNALKLMTSVDDQIFSGDDYLGRLDTDPISAGCDYGGTITYTPTDKGTSIAMTDCEFTPDVPLTGTGQSDDSAGTFKLDVTSGTDTLQYERSGDGATRVSGTFNGKKVNLKQAA